MQTEIVQQLADRQAIADLVMRLARMLDEKRFDDAPAILADDATVQTPGGASRGRAAVVEQARRNHAVPTQHVISNLLIDLDGDRAEAGANLLVTFAPDAQEPTMLGERYRFEAVREPVGWRLSAIAVEGVWRR